MQGVLYFRTRSPQHHPIARSSRALSSPPLTYKLGTISALFTDRVLCTRSHRITSTCFPCRIPTLSDLILSCHFVFVSVYSPRARSENVNVRVLFRQHGSTRAVLGTRAVWTACPRMDRLYRYPLQTENSRIPPANRDPGESLSFGWPHGIVAHWILYFKKDNIQSARIFFYYLCFISHTELIRKNYVTIIKAIFILLVNFSFKI